MFYNNKKSMFIFGLMFILIGVQASDILKYKKDTDLYIAHNLWASDSKIGSVNHKIGKIIPIGSKVTNIIVNKNNISFITMNKNFKMKYQPKYWDNMNILLFLDKMFTIKTFKELTKDISNKNIGSIKSGYVTKGMTKLEVLLSLGYPPKHATPKLSLNTWTYWVGRSAKIKIEFDDNGYLLKDFIPKSREIIQPAMASDDKIMSISNNKRVIHSPVSKLNKNKLSEFKLNFSLGKEEMCGNSTYSIGYPIKSAGGVKTEGYFPFSELEWPLDIELIRFETGLHLGKTWSCHWTLKKNISNPDDDMIDKDWVTASNPDRLDVYSNSYISDFDATIVDLNIEAKTLSRRFWEMKVGIGFQYQKFEYKAKLIRQYSPSGLPGWDATGDGSVAIEYEVEYKIPYFLIENEIKMGDLLFSGSLAFSPYTMADDIDKHLLRDKECKGDMDGFAYMINASFKYNFYKGFFIEAGGDYTMIDVEGEQKQWTSGIYTGTVHEELESEQLSYYLNIGFKF